MLRQALLNLGAECAPGHAERGHPPDLRDGTPGRVDISVEDTGVGISPSTSVGSSISLHDAQEEGAASGCRWSTGPSSCTTARSRQSTEGARHDVSDLARRLRDGSRSLLAMVGIVRRCFLVAAIVALASGGCATARAKTPAMPPPLDAAPPPASSCRRTPTLLCRPDSSRRSRRSRRRRRAAPSPRPDTMTEAPKPVDPPAWRPPSPTLQQTLPKLTPRRTEGRCRGASCRRGPRTPWRVKTATLNADAKSRIDTANRFVAQADQALNEGNLVFAAMVAEKAAALRPASRPLTQEPGSLSTRKQNPRRPG